MSAFTNTTMNTASDAVLTELLSSINWEGENTWETKAEGNTESTDAEWSSETSSSEWSSEWQKPQKPICFKKPVKSDDFPPSDRVFVAKIQPGTTEEHLKEYFSQFGEVVDVFMPRNPKQNWTHKGIAFVSFSDCDTAKNVREIVGHTLWGQQLIVDHAASRNMAASAQNKAKGHSAWQINRPQRKGEDWNWSPAAKVKEMCNANNKSVSKVQLRIKVSNIPESISCADLTEYFQQFGKLSDCLMPSYLNQDQILKTAFVVFEDEDLAKDVLGHEEYEVKVGAYVSVSSMKEWNQVNDEFSMGKSPSPRRGGNRASPY